MPLLGSKKSLRDIFLGNSEELAIAKRVIQLCLDHYTMNTIKRLENSMDEKNFD